jgi:predicted component of type VI protein secretion system
MDEEFFNRVASSKCNWSERSLGVAKALIVEGKSPSAVAAAMDPPMTPQQANVLRTRFLAKAEELRQEDEKARVERFMQREKPKSPVAALVALEDFAAEMQVLRDKGYTDEQIVSFLQENGVLTSPATVRKFFRSRT